jgi:hypothetical protein
VCRVNALRLEKPLANFEDGIAGRVAQQHRIYRAFQLHLNCSAVPLEVCPCGLLVVGHG